MNPFDISAGLILLASIMALSVPLGRYMARVFSGERTLLSRFLVPAENLIYRACGVDPSIEMTWKTYALSFTIFNVAGIALLTAIQLAQGPLPLNPQNLPAVRWDTALNTAVSFVTNTNWQSYPGETTMSHLAQMAGLTVQNFLSAAIGMAAGLALVRGFSRRESERIGNLWVDMTRSVLYVLLPISILVAVVLLTQGVIQNLGPNVHTRGLEGAAQVIPAGPVASQIAIKQLGSNGGGFFNANSAHPFENPTLLSNAVELASILLIPMAFIFMFGYMIKNVKQGRALYFAVFLLFAAGLAVVLYSELRPNPVLVKIGLSGPFGLEGKETRFGEFWSALWAQATTATSNGSVNAMHDSFQPLSGLVLLFNIGIGEVIFGGVGVGLIGMLFYVILSMFIAGLMIGRTPEFMGKKFGPFEMAMSMIAMLLPMVAMIAFSAVAISTEAGLSGISNPSAHGLSEILYAYSSGHGNNGSAFAGLNADTVFYNCTLAAAMLIGRFATIIPALAVAGSLARKKTVPESAATFPTTGPLFVVVLIGVILVMGALTFFPVYALGPVLEHFFVNGMRSF